MELLHAKLDRAETVRGMAYKLQLVFGSPIRGPDGKAVAEGKTVNMQFINGMEPEHMIIGLRELANHLEAQHAEAQPDEKPNGLRLVDSQEQ